MAKKKNIIEQSGLWELSPELANPIFPDGTSTRRDFDGAFKKASRPVEKKTASQPDGETKET